MKHNIKLLLFCVIAACSPSLAATYYVDYAAGADTNSGTAKATPWKRAPGMQGCASVCLATTVNAGDSIILKGGVTWPNVVFDWSLPWGATGNPVYVGVDKTWYVGGSWARPILDAQGIVIANNRNTMFEVGANVTVDNFEIKGFHWTTASCSGATYGQCGMFNAGQRDGQVWSNLYIHGWTHAGTDASTSNGVVNLFSLGGGGTSIAHDNVIDGSDVPGDHSVTVFFNGPPIAYNNHIKQVSSAFIVSYATSIHDNYIEDIGPAYCNMPFPANAGACTHENGFEDNGNTGLYFYNNVITNITAGLALWVAPNPGYTAYIFNNVIYGVHGNQILDLAPPVYYGPLCTAGATGNNYCLETGSFVLYNNTIQCGDDSTLYDCQGGGNVGSGSVATSLLYRNNHFISATTANTCYTGAGQALSCTFDSTNLVQTLSTANAQGYNSLQTYAFSPASMGASTVGAGVNLAGSATGGAASLSSDTALGGTRSPLSRPVSSAWDIGAYQYAGALNRPRSVSGRTSVRGGAVIR